MSVDDGGLAVLEGSSRFGVRRHWNKDLLGLVGGAGGIGVTCKQLEERGCVWKTAEYKAGDMLLFNSLAIHQALPNLSDDIRLSCDFRYSETAMLCHPHLTCRSDADDCCHQAG